MFDTVKRAATVIVASGALMLGAAGVASAGHDPDTITTTIEQIGCSHGLVAVNNVAVPVIVDAEDAVDVEGNNVVAALLGVAGIDEG